MTVNKRFKTVQLSLTAIGLDRKSLNPGPRATEGQTESPGFSSRNDYYYRDQTSNERRLPYPAEVLRKPNNRCSMPGSSRWTAALTSWLVVFVRNSVTFRFTEKRGQRECGIHHAEVFGHF